MISFIFNKSCFFSRCVTRNFVFVDTNATSIEDDEIVPETKPTLLSLPPPLSAKTKPTQLSLPPPLSANKESTSEDDGAAGITKCKICGSVFLKSKIDSSNNRGMCYSCYSKKTNAANGLLRGFQNYLVTDENKQSHFLCDLCEFSCDAFPDVFAHHYKTSHPQANLFQNCIKDKNDPMSKFALKKNGVRYYKCDQCNMSCISRNLFAKHYTEHGDQSFQIETLNIEFKDNKFCCNICKKSFVQFNSAKSHMKRVHGPKKYICGVCQKGFRSKHQAVDHEKLHSKVKAFMCDLCGHRFAAKITLKTHINNEACLKNTCESCGHHFYKKIHLYDHLYRCMQKKINAANAVEDTLETGQQSDQSGITKNASIQQTVDFVPQPLMKYECAKCNKKFKNKLSLRIHIVEEFQLTPYQCFICDQKFTTTVLLKKHLFSCNKTILDNGSGDDFSFVINHGDSFGCKLCGRKCRKIGYLRQHFKLHSKIQPYVCQFCGKSYVMKSAFRAHMLTETNQRKYACSICEKRYNTSSHLTAHIKKHHRLREFKCNSCDKEFAFESDLKEHEKTHEKVKMFCCDKCGGLFKTAKYLKVHLDRCDGWKQKSS